MEGFDLKWHGETAIDRVRNAGIKKLREVAGDLQRLSSNEAPLDKGKLRGDAGTDESKLNSHMQIRVGYSVPYALVQHESLHYNHTDGKAKFLEDPFNANKARYKRELGQTVEGAIR